MTEALQRQWRDHLNAHMMGGHAGQMTSVHAQHPQAAHSYKAAANRQRF